MEVKQLFDGVYSIDGRLATLNLTKGKKVYGEELIDLEERQYRSWTPYRSKLSAAILNGMKTMEIKHGSKVLYLGASTGTTSSHVSDIVGAGGSVYCIEMSERSMRDLVNLCQSRVNMLPILADAGEPQKYADVIDECDALYQDVSARDQAGILRLNGRFLKSGGYAYFVIKSQSIDVSRQPSAIFKEALDAVSVDFEIVERVELEPYDSMHLFAVLKKK